MDHQKKFIVYLGAVKYGWGSWFVNFDEIINNQSFFILLLKDN